MKTAKDLELSLLLKESHIQQLNLRVNNLSGTIDNLLQRNDDLKKEIERLNKIINEIINAYNNQDYANLFVLLRKERKERLNIDRE